MQITTLTSSMQFREDWGTALPTPHVSEPIPPDTPLSKHGAEQAEEFAAHIVIQDPPVDVIYSSPFYRCVQSVEPTARALERQMGRKIEIRGEPGLG